MDDDLAKLKSRIQAERRYSRKLEKQIEKMEREVYRELKHSKDDIVERIYSKLDGGSDFNRILHSTSNDSHQPKIELII